MKRGFTLLELVVVIVILGVLATLGFTQYGRMVERARGAEARMILGDIRKLAIAYRLGNGSINGTLPPDYNIGIAEGQFPYYNQCRSSHYFNYWVSGTGVPQGVQSDPILTATAYRCTTGGKAPQGVSAGTLILTTNLTSGQDTWGGTGGY